MATGGKRELDEDALAEVSGGWFSPSHVDNRTAGNPTIIGSDAANKMAIPFGAVVHANGGDDLIEGTDSQSRYTVIGGAGDDSVRTHDGNDLLLGGDGADTLYGGRGDNTLAGGRGDDVVYGLWGNHQFHWQPGDGNDRICGGLGNSVIVLEDTGMTVDQLKAAITLDDGFSFPADPGVPGWLSLGGARGTITIGGETIRFERITSIHLGDYHNFAGR
jgi:Ca2+-binding RTX toxin-like protein